MKLVKWFKKLQRIVKNYDNDYKWLRYRMVEATDLIKERTDISVDVHLTNHNPNQIIVTGRYHNRDYVQVYTLADNELHTLIEQLREMQRYGVVSKIDAPFYLKEVIKKDISR